MIGRHPLPPAFLFKLALARQPGLLGPRLKNITPFLRTPVFILEGPLRPSTTAMISPEAIKVPFPAIMLQAVPYDAVTGECYVFVILDNRLAKIRDKGTDAVLSIMSVEFDDSPRMNLMDMVVDVNLSTRDINYYHLHADNSADGTEAPANTKETITFLANMALSSLHAMTNDMLDQHTSGVRQQHRDRKLTDRKLGPGGWTYRLVRIDPAKHAASAAQDLGGTHASPSWHERRGHWRHLRSGKQTWVRHCEVGDKGRGGIIHDYVVADPGG
jgi:hypothetical protein